MRFEDFSLCQAPIACLNKAVLKAKLGLPKSGDEARAGKIEQAIKQDGGWMKKIGLLKEIEEHGGDRSEAVKSKKKRWKRREARTEGPKCWTRRDRRAGNKEERCSGTLRERGRRGRGDVLALKAREANDR